MIPSRQHSLILVLFSAAAHAFVPSSHRGRTAFATRMSMSSSSSMSDGEHRRNLAEFYNLEPLPDTDVRRERKERDSLTQAKFVTYGDDLWDLRKDMGRLSAELMDAITNDGGNEADYIRDQLHKMEGRDPELVYKIELEEMMEAELDGRTEDAQKHKEKAMAARSCLPQFNLEGLWVGKYGEHGYEMINVTYAGDILVGYKVTGDKNVPRGEITFQADLSPLNTPRKISASQEEEDEDLQPIMLTDKAAKKWGTRQLPRYNGLGQVAEEGFINNQWMEGQLILIGEGYFSFAWVPIEHQIFFGRPSAELALKMLRDGGVEALKDKAWKDAPPTIDDDLGVLKQYAAHCLEVTSDTIEEDLKGDAFGCIWHGMDTEECYFE